MRLLDTETGQFVEKDPEDDDTVYAIFSHTWDKLGEQTYNELNKIQRRHEPGSHVSKASRLFKDRLPLRILQRGSSPQAPPSQPPSDPSSSTTRPPTARRRLTQSTLLCFIKVYSLAKSTPPPSIWDDPDLSTKIRDACAVARKNGYRYIWIDSCCIDKSSSSELSEAINSMYKWYGLADVCYAYLADVPPGDDHHAERSPFRKSRWFKRGWTLQELIAPVNVVFLSNDWAPIGSKHALDGLVESVTGIDHRALLHVDPLHKFSVAQRLSWAAWRKTTREEDRAYSLLGIFDINMPTLYGEGNRAFQRLQEHIMQRIPDQSVFAWENIYLPDSPPPKGPIALEAIHRRSLNISLSARSPDRFGGHSRSIRHVQLPTSLHYDIDYTPTPYGIRAQFQMIPLTQDLLSAILRRSEVELRFPDNSSANRWYLAILGCEHTERPGYLLGRVCYIPSSDSGVQFVYTTYISVSERGYSGPSPDLFPLLPSTIEQFRPHLELKTVYIPHLDPADPLQSLRYRLYTAIKLVLLTETRDALCSRGYSADLRYPGPDHPTTHWLTLSRQDRQSITIEFQHILGFSGAQFGMTAKVKISGSGGVQIDSAPSVSWNQIRPWHTTPDYRTVRLSAGLGAGTLTVDIGLEFAGTGVYVVRVDVRSSVPHASLGVDSTRPVASAVKSAVDKEGVVVLSGDNSPSGTIGLGA